MSAGAYAYITYHCSFKCVVKCFSVGMQFSVAFVVILLQ